MESPEESGEYICPCGNIRSFTGYDDQGYPGPNECRCGKDICDCTVVLEQQFTVQPDGEIDYLAFIGGGQDAEIQSYTRIQCAVCKAFIWPPPDDAPSPA